MVIAGLRLKMQRLIAVPLAYLYSLLASILLTPFDRYLPTMWCTTSFSIVWQVVTLVFLASRLVVRLPKLADCNRRHVLTQEILTTAAHVGPIPY